MAFDVDQTAAQAMDQLQNTIGKPEEWFHGLAIIGHSLLSVLICAITSIYMLVDHTSVGRFFLRFIPTDKRATVSSLASQMDGIFRKYVIGQLALIMLMSFVGFCILKTFNIKYALLLALLSGFLEIIPVLGPLLVYIVIFIFAFAQLGLFSSVLILGCFGIARLVEDYLIVPNTVGHAVELHPLATIFAVIVGEKLAGALGMLIAIPVAAAFKVVVDFLYPPAYNEEHKHRSLLSMMLGYFKKPDHTASERERKERIDLEAINSMHEASEGALHQQPAPIAPLITIKLSEAQDTARVETTSGAAVEIASKTTTEREVPPVAKQSGTAASTKDVSSTAKDSAATPAAKDVPPVAKDSASTPATKDVPPSAKDSAATAGAKDVPPSSKDSAATGAVKYSASATKQT
ncbi:MAG: AI-2E family transporter, partial [Terriglobales bacterium]